MTNNWHDEYDLIEMVGPVIALKHTISRATNLQPSAIILPLSLSPHIQTAWGTPVIRGDRVALLYEPER